MRVCPVCGRPGAASEVRCPHDGASLVVLEGSLEARETDLLGQVVDGRYRVEAVIGRGGMGIVFAARHVVVGRRVALKVLKPSMEHSEDTLQRFVREAQAANAVRSPYILRADDFGQLSNGAFYVVMDLLEGAPLGDALRERRLAHDTLLDVFIQVAEGLGAAHAAGVVHRDLKPDNVFLVTPPSGTPGPSGPQVRILDFGVAKLMHQGAGGLTETGVILGTPHYMSPEQARGLELDHRSDIYALGVVMFQAFTGRLPFIADSAVGVLTAHAVEDPPRPSLSGVDGTLEAIILKCMQKRPEGRFQTMFDVAAALRQRRGRPAGPPSPSLEDVQQTGRQSHVSVQMPAPPSTASHLAQQTGMSTAMSAAAPAPVSRGLYLALGAGIAIVGVVGALLVTGRVGAKAQAAPNGEPAGAAATSGSAPSAATPPASAPTGPSGAPESAAPSAPTNAAPSERPPASASAASAAPPSRPPGPGARPGPAPSPPPAPPPAKPPARPEIRSPFD